MRTEFIDITVPLHAGCRVWPGDPPFEAERFRAIGAGNKANVSLLRTSVHVGTHIDAPHHVIESGAAVDELDLSIFVGPAVVVDIQTPGHISADLLDRAVAGRPERLLLRTRNSLPGGALDQSGFTEKFCALTADAADWIVERGVGLLGIDYCSIEPADGDGTVHRRLLTAGVVLLECVDLRRVAPGDYELLALPLRLRGLDGSPVRAVLRAGSPGE